MFSSYSLLLFNSSEVKAYPNPKFDRLNIDLQTESQRTSDKIILYHTVDLNALLTRQQQI